MMLRLGCAALALAFFVPLASSAADAQSERRTKSQKSRSVEQAKPLEIEGPLLMQVSLNEQRMYIYDANGLVTQTRISSGRAGHETPKGIYSILEKKVDHTSNIYLDAKMPHMQRLTMTGIALHGGVVPGYPASGGCVRLPFDFARRFFNLTDINQRVVIAPDVQSPTTFEHSLLFASLPSVAHAGPTGDRAEGPGANAVRVGVDVAETLLGVTSAHAATEPPGRTLESAAEARRAERQGLVDDITEAGERRAKAAEGEKAAARAIGDAKAAAKAARSAANGAAREAYKAKAALQSQERALKKVVSRIPNNPAKMRADRLETLRAQEAELRSGIAPREEEVRRTAEAAKDAADKAATADKAVAAAVAGLKEAKAEIKNAAAAETAAKKAVATFDRQEQNRGLPVSVFISSKTGLIQVRQGFEAVLEVQASIADPDVPLDTFVFTAVGWKDDSKTDLRWTATEVNEHSTRIGSGDVEVDNKGKRKSQSVPPPPETDVARAARTLDRISIPKEASERIAEVVKPGSTLIVSSYDVARSETRYAGTDFIVQMPEVVAKITKPTPRPRPVELVEEQGGGGCFFFCSSSYSSSKQRDRRRQRASGKSSVW
ncbi:L,D-transpeptidase family protein [Hyphomicrobium sp.]|uniref:L,D-transpeptidase family protein n=1 Tax=Hyphomicrobium sp. TaxID=82 RepID=UPI0025BC70B1|nr:L,D-transpeptidase family protein [Hyphomicrobium sp.]MCC7252305.1 L,D-transpeptidase family protein [Hyphomicrobium sp.]